MKLKTLLQLANDYQFDDQLINAKESGRREFLNRFPLESLQTITLEEYADTRTKDSFIYWLERKNILGGIGGGNSSKFGIYRAKTGDYCKGYGEQKVLLKGEQLEEEFRALRSGINQAISLAKEGRISEIASLELSVFNMIILKILNIYVPDTFFNIYSPPILIELGKEFSIRDQLLLPQNSIELNHKVLQAMKKETPFSQWSNQMISRFVWDTFSERDKSIDQNSTFWLVGHTYAHLGSIREYLIQSNKIGVVFYMKI